MKAEDHTVLFADSNYSQKQIEDLRKWIDSIISIMYNGGNVQSIDTLIPS
jgi:hypothetical protein